MNKNRRLKPPFEVLPAAEARRALPARERRRVWFNGVAGIEQEIEREEPLSAEPREHRSLGAHSLGAVSEPLS